MKLYINNETKRQTKKRTRLENMTSLVVITTLLTLEDSCLQTERQTSTPKYITVLAAVSSDNFLYSVSGEDMITIRNQQIFRMTGYCTANKTEKRHVLNDYHFAVSMAV